MWFNNAMERDNSSDSEMEPGPSMKWDPAQSLWGRVKNLPIQIQRQLLEQYRDPFTVEVRDQLAELIEQLQWNEIENAEDEVFANQILETVLQTLSDKVRSTQEFVLKTKLRDSEHKLRQRYGGNALEFVTLVRTYLAQEQRVIDQAENAKLDQGGDTQFHRQIFLSQKIENLQKRTQMAQTYIQPLDEKFKSFIISKQRHSQLKAQLQQVESQMVSLQDSAGCMAHDLYQHNFTHLSNQKEQLARLAESTNGNNGSMAKEMLQLRLDFTKEFQQTNKELEELNKLIDQEVLSWKRQQSLAANGAEFDLGSLDSIQNWVEALADLIWKNRNQITQMERFGVDFPINVPQGIQENIQRLKYSTNNMLKSLVMLAFVVERQPPQILKINNKFTAKVRLLLGNKLKTYLDPPKVTAVLLSERQLIKLQESESPRNFKENSGKLLNDTGRMEYSETTMEHSVSLKSMQLQKVNRADRRQNVTEEKFCIIFKTKLQIGTEEEFVWTRSNPIVVTVHGSQECRAMGTIMWDNQFAIPDRKAFEVPDSVPWPQMADLLSCKFKSMTGRGLGQDDLDYLAHKVFIGQHTSDDFSQDVISWSKFIKENLQLASGPVNFPFWDWFHSIMKLTAKHLRELWQEECIKGFISRQKAEEQLLSVLNGNFLLRFSESELGGITVGWVDDANPGDTHNSKREVNFAQPYEAEDFMVKSLADRIKDVDRLMYLYPDIPKETAFKKHWLYPHGRKKPVNPRYQHFHSLIQSITTVSPAQDQKLSRKRDAKQASLVENGDVMDHTANLVAKCELTEKSSDMSGFGSEYDNTLNVDQIINEIDMAQVTSPGSISLDAFDLVSEEGENF